MVGTVGELWRYPVKSMRGERIDHADVQAGYGIPGDRGWAVRDDTLGEIRSAKQVPALLHCSARYLLEPTGQATPAVEITLPDGSSITSDDPLVHRRLSSVLGSAVTLWPRVAPEHTEHFLRRIPIDDDERRRQYGLAEDEPFPEYDPSAPPRKADLRRYVSPLGTYFDADELHIVTTGTVDGLRARHPGAGVDVRRFRPNILIDTGPSGGLHDELSWVGRQLRIGGLVVAVPRRTIRCNMIVHAQAELPRDRAVRSAIARETGHALGVAGEIVTPGPVAIGDPVELL